MGETSGPMVLGGDKSVNGVASSQNDSKPRGEGVGTENYSIEVIMSIKIVIEGYLEEKYKCFKLRLSQESERKCEDEETDNPLNIPFFNFPLGPGRIGDNINGRKRGYANRSNIFVGRRDRTANIVSCEVDQIKEQEEEIYELEKVENCIDEEQE